MSATGDAGLGLIGGDHCPGQVATSGGVRGASQCATCSGGVPGTIAGIGGVPGVRRMPRRRMPGGVRGTPGPKSGVPGTGTAVTRPGCLGWRGCAGCVGCVAWLGCFTSGTFDWSGGFAVAGSPAALRSSLMMPRIPDRIRTSLTSWFDLHTNTFWTSWIDLHTSSALLFLVLDLTRHQSSSWGASRWQALDTKGIRIDFW